VRNTHLLKYFGDCLHGLRHVGFGHVTHAANTECIGKRKSTWENDEASLLHAFEQSLKSERH